MEESSVVEWTLVSECDIPADVHELLVPGEHAVAAYKTFRDSAIFTTRRLIFRDAQGVTGKKVEVYSLPWSSVHMWSSENAGRMDMSAEVELWTRINHITITVKRGIDVRRLDRVIAASVLS